MFERRFRIGGRRGDTPGRTGTARSAALIALASFGGLVLSASPVLAAGTGYGGTGGTGGGTGILGTLVSPPGFTSILSTVTVNPSGGTISAGGLSITVPAGDVTVPTQVETSQGTLTLLSGLPAGADPVFAFGISFLQNGQKFTGSFPQPIPVTITNGAITSADQLEVWSSTTGSYIPVSQDPDITGVSVGYGTISFQITGDPYFVVLGAQSSTVVPNATIPITGFPVLGEGLLGLGLMGGGLLLARSLRPARRRSTR